MLALVSQECWPPNLANAFIVCPPPLATGRYYCCALCLHALLTRVRVCVCFVFSSASVGKLIETHSLSFTFTFPYSAAYAQRPRCRILNLPQACHVYTLCPAISKRALSTSHSHTEVDRVHTHTHTHNCSAGKVAERQQSGKLTVSLRRSVLNTLQ